MSGIPPLGKLKLIATILLEQQPLTQRSARPQPDYRIRTGTRPLSSSQAVSRGRSLLSMLGVLANWKLTSARAPDGIHSPHPGDRTKPKHERTYKGRPPTIQPHEVRRLKDEEKLGASSIAERLGIGGERVSVLKEAMT